MTIAVTICALTLAGSAFAAPSSQAAPPPTQTAPPPTQTPPAGQKPAPPAPAPKPAVPFPADAKIGFVDMQRLVNESALGKKGQASMKTLRDKLSAPILAKQKELIALQEKIQTQANLVAEAVLNVMKRDLDRGQRELQSMQEGFDIETQQHQADLIQNFSATVQPLVEKLRDERGLWAVWVPTNESGLYAVHPGLDLTAEVLKRLDALPVK